MVERLRRRALPLTFHLPRRLAHADGSLQCSTPSAHTNATSYGQGQDMKPGILTRTAFAAASVAVLVPLAGCGGGDIPPSRPPGTSSPSSPRASTNSSGTEYKDGTYTAKGIYGG